MSHVKITKINEHIYLLNEDNESTGYVVVGREKAVLIDTMNGKENTKKLVETITNLPIMLINTHGHPDHIGGNSYFSEAYINPAEIALADSFMVFKENDTRKRMNWNAISPGDVIDLGGLCLEVFSLAGHTAGSICLLDRQDRILFCGDGVNPHLWMQLDHCLSMKELVNTLNHLEDIRGEFDFIMTGHGNGLIDASTIDEIRQAAIDVIEGRNEKDYPYEYFGGVCMAHPYDENDANKVIVYNPNTNS